VLNDGGLLVDDKACLSCLPSQGLRSGIARQAVVLFRSSRSLRDATTIKLAARLLFLGIMAQKKTRDTAPARKG